MAKDGNINDNSKIVSGVNGSDRKKFNDNFTAIFGEDRFEKKRRLAREAKAKEIEGNGK